MSQHPIPTIIISSLTAKGSDLAIRSLEMGAVEIIQKDALSIDNFSNDAQRIIDVVKAAGKSVIRRRIYKQTIKAEQADSLSEQPIVTSNKVIAIGASTGGTEAIRSVLQDMPIDCPGIVVVQHMPEVFTSSFAHRLNSLCRIQVKEASDGDSVLRGQALIAPGNFHMEVRRSGAKYFVQLNQNERVNRHRPSVDVLFWSLAKYAGQNAVGILMTGMGSDGAKGLLSMKEMGGQTFAQNEQTCVVYGMPREAVRLNAVEKTTSLHLLAEQALRSINYALA